MKARELRSLASPTICPRSLIARAVAQLPSSVGGMELGKIHVPFQVRFRNGRVTVELICVPEPSAITQVSSARLQACGVILYPGDVGIVASTELSVTAWSSNGRLHGARIPPFVQLHMTVHKRESAPAGVTAGWEAPPHVTRRISIEDTGKPSETNVIFVMIREGENLRRRKDIEVRQLVKKRPRLTRNF